MVTGFFVRRLAPGLAALALSVAALPGSALAQDEMTAIAVPDQPTAIVLGTGPLPGASAGESWHMQYGSHFARNVAEATLTPFLPDPAIANGTAVVVAPGGGFRTLSMENEGWDVARALAARGVAAFVLKYRLNPTPPTLDEFVAGERARFSGDAPPPPRPSPAERMAGIAPMLEDATAAFALIRANAEEWGIDPARIGMVGFSAGAMLTMATGLDEGDADPAFIGNIYGPLSAMGVRPDSPPLFVALAADDPLFPETDFGLIREWRAADIPVEFHYYEQGGHGFGMYPKDTTSTGWFDAFAAWMTMHGWMEREGG
ncbi:alpha/beta hydrolase [Erythrobacter sp. EC-HK427]|uniref:alpha/beta hydrolase n=1 Tax=Erythrobacter sp. EC-HK427 TaxID=2038396 RepID=UPI001256F28A|nr:alpha/beta hydrolase [Erythrobacter sp. EC-HK427]VVS99692.1 Esterase [Erythrobacter sp. EC-HK427]